MKIYKIVLIVGLAVVLRSESMDDPRDYTVKRRLYGKVPLPGGTMRCKPSEVPRGYSNGWVFNSRSRMQTENSVETIHQDYSLSRAPLIGGGTAALGFLLFVGAKKGR